ncbi:MAG TPA: EF-hand domain-containing protein [Sphingomonas sp.]|jgi:hypothetical protein|uniref:EF-hand domain-containing protein n=1 Tax=Sphingomonas sp. TaxID=28214 RepID=UPI002EDA5C89
MKMSLLAAMTFAVAPASAQTVPSPAPITAAPAPVAPVTSPASPVTSTSAAPQPASSDAEVAAIVAREFPAYDKDASGGLSAGEFGAWMVRLKAIADPALQPDAPSTRTWLGAAFAQADLDKSRSVTLAELTGFLSPARS